MVTLQWTTGGDACGAALTAVPAVPGLGAVPWEGRMSVAVQQSTVFTLRASSLFGAAEPSQQEVVVADGHAPPKPFGAIATCDAAKQVVAASFEVGADFAEQLHAIAVANPYERELIVAHDGVTMTLGPKATSDRLRTQPAAGHWTLQASLRADETCETALAAVASRLVATLTFGC